MFLYDFINILNFMYNMYFSLRFLSLKASGVYYKLNITPPPLCVLLDSE